MNPRDIAGERTKQQQQQQKIVELSTVYQQTMFERLCSLSVWKLLKSPKAHPILHVYHINKQM